VLVAINRGLTEATQDETGAGWLFPFLGRCYNGKLELRLSGD